MFNKKDLNTLIENIDKEIYLYSLNFQNLQQYMTNFLGVDIKITNERTMASLASEAILKWIEVKGYKVDLTVNELSIKTDNFDDKTVNELNEEVDNKSLTRKWSKRMFVDSFFQVRDLYCEGINNLFVEYKMSNKFDFTQLAQDFLKFKFYTRKNSKISIFTYVLFSKKEMYPSILSCKKDKFLLIPKKITNNKKVFDGKDKIYIHIYDDCIETADLEKQKQEECQSINLEQLYQLLDKINAFSNDENESLELVENVLKLENDIFYKNIGIFNANVLIGKVITNNFKKIKQLFETSIEKNIFSNVIKELQSKTDDVADSQFLFSIENQKNLINEAKEYFYNFQRKYFKNDKKVALRKGLNSNYKSTLFLIVILNIFSKIYNVDFSPNLGVVTVDNNKNDLIKYSEVVTEITEQMLPTYLEDEYKNNITKLAFEIMYIIINLYPKIYIIENDEVKSYNEVYENVKKSKTIQKSLNKILQLLNIKEKILYSEDSFREKTIKIFEHIVNVI